MPTDDPVLLARRRQQAQEEQSLLRGALAGLGAAAVGAGVWAVVTVVTQHQIGWMAIGVGFLVGIAVRFFGKGTENTFGILGAVCALLGCLAGNLLAVCISAAQQYHLPLLEILAGLSPQTIEELLRDTFSPLDLLFYGLAMYEAYKYSFQR